MLIISGFTGDKFMAYNRTFTGSSSESRYGMLTASNGGTRTTLEGVIACKDNDELGISILVHTLQDLIRQNASNYDCKLYQ